MWLWRHVYDHLLQIMKIRYIIALVYQRSFVIVYIGAIHVFSIVILETKKQEITSILNFCWENLDIDEVSNMINNETKERNILFLFGFYYYNYLQNII